MSRTAEEKTQDYAAMGHSADLINAVIAGTQMSDEDADVRQDCVDRNVAHLEMMLAKDDWGSENMTAINAAITAGQGYTAT